jgi:hypothetical protein
LSACETREKQHNTATSTASAALLLASRGGITASLALIARALDRPESFCLLLLLML